MKLATGLFMIAAFMAYLVRTDNETESVTVASASASANNDETIVETIFESSNVSVSESNIFSESEVVKNIEISDSVVSTETQNITAEESSEDDNVTQASAIDVHAEFRENVFISSSAVDAATITEASAVALAAEDEASAVNHAAPDETSAVSPAAVEEEYASVPADLDKPSAITQAVEDKSSGSPKVASTTMSLDERTTVSNFTEILSATDTETLQQADTIVISEDITSSTSSRINITTALATASSESYHSNVAYELTEVQHIGCVCHLHYNPVCGSNGVTYSNDCMLQCISNEHFLKGQHLISKMYNGECRQLSCTCSNISKPVCGSNNQTYGNECYRNCDNNNRALLKLPLINFAYNGICRQTVCMCPNSIIPVCGTDSKTYKNICILQHYSRWNEVQGLPPIYVDHINACEVERCFCPPIKKEVCASDDNTYYNQCALDCQNRKRTQLGLTPLTEFYSGKCEKCICPLDYNPVCGSDGITYNNYCTFTCKNDKLRRAHLPLLAVRWRGPCNCDCAHLWNPICASDQKTWPNQCSLDCENNKRFFLRLPLLSILYYGECKQCNCSNCPNERKLVCGSDRFTYWNMCFLTCNSNCRVISKLPPIWKVADHECHF